MNTEQNIQLSIGGVPEHYNYPWIQAIDNGSFNKIGVQLSWQDYPGGTGAMCSALRDGSIDIAVLLTEGIIADIERGNPSKIVQTYVNSPLTWGVHVSSKSNIHSKGDVKTKKFAISRLFSGSHLMAYIYANKNGWVLTEDNFVIVKDLDGARKALKNGEADLFLWEKFTTKPLVYAGEFRRIDDCPTPWSCFVIAVRDEVLYKYPEQVSRVIETINQSINNVVNNDSTIKSIAANYGLEKEDVKQWYKALEWNKSHSIDINSMDNAAKALFELGIILKPISKERLKTDFVDCLRPNYQKEY